MNNTRTKSSCGNIAVDGARQLIQLSIFAGLLAAVVHAQDGSPAVERISRGLEVLYTFEAGSGDVVKDRSGNSQPLDLKIEKPSAVKWQDGALVVKSSTKITSVAPARALARVIKKTGSVTVEAWVKPQNDRQEGPARIVSLSSGPNQRNFTLGQDGSRFDTRFRTTSTSTNGIPSTSTPNRTVSNQLTHFVYTRNTDGTARIFINSRQRSSKRVAGKLSGWDENFLLSIANETSGDRAWLGELHLVAIYSRSLTPQEVIQNFRAGGGKIRMPAMLVERKVDPKAEHFETKIAPLLSNHCLECHDSSTRKGGLDLSRRQTALAGGESGKAILPGKSAMSALWDSIDTDTMPANRPPLSESEKELVKR